jgi:hypothetical protein
MEVPVRPSSQLEQEQDEEQTDQRQERGGHNQSSHIRSPHIVDGNAGQAELVDGPLPTGRVACKTCTVQEERDRERDRER